MDFIEFNTKTVTSFKAIIRIIKESMEKYCLKRLSSFTKDNLMAKFSMDTENWYITREGLYMEGGKRLILLVKLQSYILMRMFIMGM
jgi:hypothetical protein